MTTSARLGIFYSVAANTLWGLFPIYWTWLAAASAPELLCHRVVWSFVFALLVVLVRYRLASPAKRAALRQQFSEPSTWKTYSLAAVMIAINWLAFLWAVNNNRVLLASLGYYINPLINVLLGVIVLREHLSRSRWVALGFAGFGVTVMTIQTGELPWISFAMALAFGVYALTKKRAKLAAVEGLMLETMMLAPLAIGYLIWLNQNSDTGGLFANSGRATDLLLIFGGVVTITPLALFSAATQRVPLSLIGVLQYVGPTLQFLIGIFYFGEEMPAGRLIGFGFVWIGVAIFLAPMLQSRFRSSSA